MDSSDDAILRKKFGDKIPSVTDLSRNLSLMLVNTHYSLTGARPVSQSVVEIGGAHIKEAEPIEKVKISFKSSRRVQSFDEKIFLGKLSVLDELKFSTTSSN